MSDFRYDASLIKPVRGPDVDGEPGDWSTTWVLSLRAAVPPGALEELARTLAAIDGVHAVEAEAVDDLTARVVLRTAEHPFDPEGIPWTNAFLVQADARLGGLTQVNGSPRDWWRPFW